MADRWKQITELYHAALKLPESERARFPGKQLDSVKARIDLLSDVKMTFDEESRSLKRF